MFDWQTTGPPPPWGLTPVRRKVRITVEVEVDPGGQPGVMGSWTWEGSAGGLHAEWPRDHSGPMVVQLYEAEGEPVEVGPTPTSKPR